MSMSPFWSFFHRDERGTTITEFVITLPVFIICFIGILNLYKIEDLAVQAKSASYANALEDHRQMQSSYFPFDWSISPITGGPRAGIWHNRVSASSPRDRAADLVLDPLPVAAGHMFESWSRIAVSGPPNWAADTVGLKQPVAWKTMGGLMSDRQSDMPYDFHSQPERQGHGYDTPSAFAVDLNDDLVGGPGPSGANGWMSFMNQVLNVGGVRPAIGAGMRYGVVEGEHESSHSWMRQTYTVKDDTHFVAPPRPTSKWISLALVRLRLGADQSYDNDILAFEMDVNASNPEAQAASDCQAQLDSIDPTDLGAIGDTLDNLSDGDPCGTGGNMLGGNNPLQWFTDMIGNAASFFGTSAVPTSPTTGTVDQSSDWP